MFQISESIMVVLNYNKKSQARSFRCLNAFFPRCQCGWVKGGFAFCYLGRAENDRFVINPIIMTWRLIDRIYRLTIWLSFFGISIEQVNKNITIDC